MPLDGLSLVEADPEAVDELRLVGKGLRGVDDALCFPAHRGDEALLGRNVRVKDDALQAFSAPPQNLASGIMPTWKSVPLEAL